MNSNKLMSNNPLTSITKNVVKQSSNDLKEVLPNDFFELIFIFIKEHWDDIIIFVVVTFILLIFIMTTGIKFHTDNIKKDKLIKILFRSDRDRIELIDEHKKAQQHMREMSKIQKDEKDNQKDNRIHENDETNENSENKNKEKPKSSKEGFENHNSIVNSVEYDFINK
jgi:hypothetical protein